MFFGTTRLLDHTCKGMLEKDLVQRIL